MALRLADRLSAARQRRFVGRTDELALFRSALEAPELPFSVLYVYGPGGIGKTTLLSEFAAICTQREIPVWTLDARTIEPAPAAFTTALQRTLGLDQNQDPLQTLAAASGSQVLLIDTYELITILDSWLRDEWLPQLPEQTLVVLAGREPPQLAWRSDPGWQILFRALPLRNLSPHESDTYLATRAVPTEQHQIVLNFTHGHPLALSLIADILAQRPGSSFQPEEAPDVIKTLLEQFVQKVPGPAHRAVLEICALINLTSEPLLAAMLSLSDAHELFDWLRGLSFIEANRQGLFPHDLAREALAADLRWRNPGWYAELHRRARTYYMGRLQQTSSIEQQHILTEYIFLHRTNPLVKPFYEWQQNFALLTTAPRANDWPALVAMVARHEGQEAARIAEHWFALQPEGVTVLRETSTSAAPEPAGFIMFIALSSATPEERANDPAALAAWSYLERHAPIRPGELATCMRFWMARDSYQGISPTQTMIGILLARHFLTTPGLSFTLFPTADPTFWMPLSMYADLPRLPEADFRVGERQYGVFGHDWRVTSPTAWLALMAERELATEVSSAPRARPPSLVVLSQPAFMAATRDAIQHYARPDLLYTSALLRSRVIVDRTGVSAGNPARVAALQQLIRGTCEQLQASPRDARLYRAVFHTYLQPAETQERAAELLGLPFSTYRRHLRAGLERIAELLWQLELQGANS